MNLSQIYRKVGRADRGNEFSDMLWAALQTNYAPDRVSVWVTRYLAGAFYNFLLIYKTLFSIVRREWKSRQYSPTDGMPKQYREKKTGLNRAGVVETGSEG